MGLRHGNELEGLYQGLIHTMQVKEGRDKALWLRWILGDAYVA
ncbi:hypothetical protein HanXRQr2_Chr12g0552451 [Helianthus annuus]|uniref:Uncharacterized protein n=1 Tax=Helianthus annuus TaxID=4232 RepID=A0A9K3MX02_HELAN|nr:hypothetical protein HanXRQr2_Chr12g0552451 [Helianthus annuus]